MRKQPDKTHLKKDEQNGGMKKEAGLSQTAGIGVSGSQQAYRRRPTYALCTSPVFMYSDGVMPMMRLKAAMNTLRELKPTLMAMASMV